MKNASSDHSTFPFNALVFGLLGLMLVQACLTRSGATISAHVLAAVLGLSLIGIAFRRCQRYLLKFGNEPIPLVAPLSVRRLKVSNAAWGTLLVVIGTILGQLALWGFVTPVTVVTIGLTFVPWSRVPFCRCHLFVSILLIAAGAAYPLLDYGDSVHPLVLAVGAWAFWMSSIYAILRGR